MTLKGELKAAEAAFSSLSSLKPLAVRVVEMEGQPLRDLRERWGLSKGHPPACARSP
jgi:hypothetical protein